MSRTGDVDDAFTPYAIRKPLGPRRQAPRAVWSHRTGEAAIAFTYGRSWVNRGEETLVYVFRVDEGPGVTVVYP